MTRHARDVEQKKTATLRLLAIAHGISDGEVNALRVVLFVLAWLKKAASILTRNIKLAQKVRSFGFDIRFAFVITLLRKRKIGLDVL